MLVLWLLVELPAYRASGQGTVILLVPGMADTERRLGCIRHLAQKPDESLAVESVPGEGKREPVNRWLSQALSRSGLKPRRRGLELPQESRSRNERRAQA